MTLRQVLSIILCLGLISMAFFAKVTASPGDKDTQDKQESLSREEAKKLKSPVPFTKTRSRVAAPSMRAVAPLATAPMARPWWTWSQTQLTLPSRSSGKAEHQRVRSSQHSGWGGRYHAAFQAQIQKEDDIWHLVNFIRSLWPEAMRPKLQEEKSSEPPRETGRSRP